MGCQAPGGGNSALPSGAPALETGVWKNISPAGVNFHGGGDDVFTQGIALDPCRAGTLYLSVSSFDVQGGKPGIYAVVIRGGGHRVNRVGHVECPP